MSIYNNSIDDNNLVAYHDDDNNYPSSYYSRDYDNNRLYMTQPIGLPYSTTIESVMYSYGWKYDGYVASAYGKCISRNI